MEKNKSRKIKIMVMTMLLCVAMLSATTYAWFQLTNSPSVSKLSLKAGTVGSLQISKNANNGFTNSIDLTSMVPANSCLRPLTTIDGKTFYKPVYSNQGKVSGVEAKALTAQQLAAVINKTEEAGGYLVQTEFYLKASTGEDKTISIRLAGDGVEGAAAGDYTKVENKGTGDTAAAAVRISFAANKQVKVMEPNADAVLVRDGTQYAMAGWNNLATVQQGQNHKFKQAGGTAYNQAVSDVLFTMPTNQAVKVTMSIWIEGADPDCVNDIAGDLMSTQIRFISQDMN